MLDEVLHDFVPARPIIIRLSGGRLQDRYLELPTYRDVLRHDSERADKILKGFVGKRLTYETTSV